MTRILTPKEQEMWKVCRNPACGYEWMAKVKTPKACPRCKARQDAPKKVQP